MAQLPWELARVLPDQEPDEGYDEQVRGELRRNLRRLMDERRMDVGELSSRSGVSRKSIERYVAGTRVPSIVLAQRLADALAVDLGELTKPEGLKPQVWH